MSIRGGQTGLTEVEVIQAFLNLVEYSPGRLISGLDPGLVKMSVFDRFVRDVAFAVFGDSCGAEVMTVGGVKGSILCLDDARVVKGASTRRFLFKVPFPFPCPAFIVGKRHGKLMASLFEIVADQDPVSVLQRNDFSAGSWIRQVRVAHRTPGFPAILRFTVMQPRRRWTG